MAHDIQLPPHTEALDEFIVWLAADPKRTRVFVGTAVGTTGQAVSQWLARKSRPNPQVRKRLEALTGIAEWKWLTTEERAAEAGALRAAAEQAS